MKESVNKTFNQFKIHTQYSICEGAIKIDQLKDFCKKNKIKVKEKNFKLNEVLNADEAFCTGSFAGIVPVNQINKKKYSLKKNPITKELTNFYNNLI